MKLTDFAQRADQIILLGQQAAATSGRTPYGGTHLSESAFMEFRVSALSFLRSTFGPEHPYCSTFDKETPTAIEFHALAGLGIMAAAKAEVLGGWNAEVTGLVSAEIFSDFLEMAEHLLSQKYKDAAAVMIGGVLEEHLRQLCRMHSMAVVHGGPDHKPKPADLLNSELAGAKIYSALDHKAVTT